MILYASHWVRLIFSSRPSSDAFPLSNDLDPVWPSAGTSLAPLEQSNVLTKAAIPHRWIALDESLHKAKGSQCVDAKLPMAADFDAHIIISGVLHGWESISSAFRFTAVWECLRVFDTLSLRYTNVVGRLAALRLIALILRACFSDVDMTAL